jgi:hypothetical protein
MIFNIGLEAVVGTIPMLGGHFRCFLQVEHTEFKVAENASPTGGGFRGRCKLSQTGRGFGWRDRFLIFKPSTIAV